MSTPAERSPRIAAKQAAARAERIAADLKNRAGDPELHANLAASYERLGFGEDGYPIDDCTCVEFCDQDPRTACSLSGQRHVHPASTGEGFGPCPVHPDASGDL